VVEPNDELNRSILDACVEFTLQVALHTMQYPLRIELLRTLSLMCPSLEGKLDLGRAWVTLQKPEAPQQPLQLLAVAMASVAVPADDQNLPPCWSLLPALLDKCFKKDKTRWAKDPEEFIEKLDKIKDKLWVCNSFSSQQFHVDLIICCSRKLKIL
jgi:hypothetical protein